MPASAASRRPNCIALPALTDLPPLDGARVRRRLRCKVIDWSSGVTRAAIQTGFHSAPAPTYVPRAADTILGFALDELDQPFSAPGAGSLTG